MAIFTRSKEYDGGDTQDVMLDLLQNDPLFKALKEANPRVDILFAFGEEDDAGNVTPAIMHQGNQAIGLASLRNRKMRSIIPFDCEILLDADWWKTATDAQQQALVAHELYHFSPKVDRKTRIIKRDDLNRPLLEIRKHDYDIGIFDAIARRFGRNAPDVAYVRKMMETSGQLYWDMDERMGTGSSESVVDAVARFASATKSMGKVTISGGGKSVTFGGKEEEQDAAGKS